MVALKTLAINCHTSRHQTPQDHSLEKNMYKISSKVFINLETCLATMLLFGVQNLWHYYTDMKETLQNLMGKTHLLSGDSSELGSTQNPT